MIHQHLLAETGTHILENIRTVELVDLDVGRHVVRVAAQPR